MNNYVPVFHYGIIPAGSYKGQNEDIPALYFGDSLIAYRDAIPDSLAYEIIKLLYENWDEFEVAHPASKYYTWENTTLVGSVPYHAGVIKYYKEKGIWGKKEDERQKRLLKELEQPK